MAKLHPSDDLEHDILHERLVSSCGISLQVIQRGVVHELKHQVQPLLTPEYLDQVNQVLVTHLLEHADFSQCDLLDNLVVLCLYELLDGHQLLCLLVPALHHHTVRALPDHPHVLILLHLSL